MEEIECVEKRLERIEKTMETIYSMLRVVHLGFLFVCLLLFFYNV